MAKFYDYFKENMDALGLPAPESLFGNLSAAVTTANVFVAHIEKYGKGITIRELALAGIRSEQLLFIGTLSASYYVGAVVGSIAVATGRTIAGGVSLSDVLFYAKTNGLRRPWLTKELQRNPKFYKLAGTGAR